MSYTLQEEFEDTKWVIRITIHRKLKIEETRTLLNPGDVLRCTGRVRSYL